MTWLRFGYTPWTNHGSSETTLFLEQKGLPICHVPLPRFRWSVRLLSLGSMFALLVCFVCLLVCLLTCLIVCLFVCVCLFVSSSASEQHAAP